jgi:hypothetical protein
MTNEKQTMQSDKAGFVGDRATIIIRSHYQEHDTRNLTVAQHAFDFVNDQSDSAWQTSQRVSPSQRAPLNIGHLDPSSCILTLSQDAPKMTSEAEKVLQNALKRNTIRITNAEGVQVGLIRPRRAMVVEYGFPVFVQSSDATALLSITAIPVHNNEEIPAE